MSEEIKIGVSAPGAKEAAQDVASLEAKIKSLRDAAARERALGEKAAHEGTGFHDIGAKAARTAASSLEAEANRLEAPLRAARKAEAKEERDAKAAALRDERAQQRAAALEKKAADKATAAETKKAALEEKEIKRAFQKEDQAAAREKEQAENARLRYWREQQREEKKQSAEGKLGIGTIARGAAALGIGRAIESAIENHFERKGIELRAAAQTAIDARQVGIMGEMHASSGEFMSELRGTRDEVFAREQNRGALANQKSGSMWKGAAAGFAAGGLGGIGLGPGAIATALIGAGVGAYTGFQSGRNAEIENEKKIKTAKEKEKKLQDGLNESLGRSAGLELESLKDRAAGRFADAKTKEWKIAGEKAYAKTFTETNDPAKAAEARAATIQLQERKWQQQIGSTLTGRSGQAAISRAAAIAAAGFDGGGGGVKQEFTTLREQLAAQHLDIREARPLANFGPRMPR